jgi:hypothetical protein
MWLTPLIIQQPSPHTSIMSRGSYTIHQTVIVERYPSIASHTVDCRFICDADLSGIVGSPSVGAAVAFNNRGGLAAIAIATAQHAVVIQSTGGRAEATTGWEVLRNAVFQSPMITVYAFDGHVFALSLFQDLKLPACNVIDLQSVNSSKRDPITVIKFCLGPDVDVYEENLQELFQDSTWDDHANTGINNLIQKSWLAFLLSRSKSIQLQLKAIPPINLMTWPDQVSYLGWVMMNGYL